MKKCMGILCLLFFLTGCSAEEAELRQVMELRENLLKSSGCTFLCDVTADYGDAVHKFSMDCRGDDQGTVYFTVTAPETIAGITGNISHTGGQLTFDDTALQFDLLTDQQLSPVSGPWIFLKALRSGSLLNAGREEDLIHVGIRDSYEEDALYGDLWLGPGDLPQKAEFLFRNRKVLTLEIQNFTMDP